MKALVLAAGLGNRLGTFTQDIPKAMVSVGGRRLIDYVFSFLDHPAITEIGVVGGYQSDVLASYIQSQSTQKQVTFFHNPHFQKGSILTLATALSFLDDDTLLMNTDHIYPPALLGHIVTSAKGLCAMCDFNRTLVADDMKVKLNNQRQITAIHKELTDFDGGYIGMTHIGHDHLPTYREAIDQTLADKGEMSSVEWILGTLAASQHPISICDTSAFTWYEVDTPDDRQIAETAIATRGL